MIIGRLALDIVSIDLVDDKAYSQIPVDDKTTQYKRAPPLE
jgi:hypothetical protein